MEESLNLVLNILRSLIYIGMFTIWGLSVRRRIVQSQVRRYLSAVFALMVFWMVARSARYLIAQSPWTLRHLWYLYYLPMLFIPLLVVLSAFSLGRPEHFRLPSWTNILYIPPSVLFLLVLTNDFHQLVFVFPADAQVWMNDYSYGPGYYLAVGWMLIMNFSLRAVFRHVAGTNFRNPKKKPGFWLRFT